MELWSFVREYLKRTSRALKAFKVIGNTVAGVLLAVSYFLRGNAEIDPTWPFGLFIVGLTLLVTSTLLSVVLDDANVDRLQALHTAENEVQRLRGERDQIQWEKQLSSHGRA